MPNVQTQKLCRNILMLQASVSTKRYHIQLELPSTQMHSPQHFSVSSGMRLIIVRKPSTALLFHQYGP